MSSRAIIVTDDISTAVITSGVDYEFLVQVLFNNGEWQEYGFDKEFMANEFLDSILNIILKDKSVIEYKDLGELA